MASVKYVVKYSDGTYLGYGWKRHQKLGDDDDNRKGWRYTSREYAVDSMRIAHDDFGYKGGSIVRLVSKKQKKRPTLSDRLNEINARFDDLRDDLQLLHDALEASEK